MKLKHPNFTVLSRYPFYLLGALLFNAALFLLIQQLVTNERGLSLELENVSLVDFIRVKQQRSLEEPPPPEDLIEPEPEDTPPPPSEMVETEVEKPQVSETQFDMALPNIDVPMSLSGTPFIGDFVKSTKSITTRKQGRPKIDTNVVPTLRIPPVYPPRALRSGIEGVVTVEFTIATDGSVKDSKIVKSKPPKIFDRAVLAAISKWKFNPDIVNGEKREKRARQDINFKLER